MTQGAGSRSTCLVVCAAAALWLALSAILPLEAEVQHPLGPLLFAVKILLTFAALLPMLHGLGQLTWWPLQRLGRIFSTPGGHDDEVAERRWLRLTLPALLGTATCGLLTFALGLLTPPAAWMVYALLGLGLALFCCCPPQLPRWREVWPQNSWERALWALVAFGYAVRWGDALFFQGQEDAFLYHLSLAELWLRHQQTGVQLANIYSGYALDIEHYYLWLKLLARGTAEQNALAQWTHLGIGYGVCLAALRALGGRWLGGVKTAAMLALALHGPMIATMILPKNDGFLAACCLTALYGLIAVQPAYFLAGAAFAMAIKPTAGMIFILIAGAALSQPLLAAIGVKRQANRFSGPTLLRQLTLLSCGAALMILGWAPYGWRNTVITGNPFFPLLGELFSTPFAPGLQSVIVEARPFSLPPSALLRSLLNWLLSEPAALLAVAAALAAQCSRASSQGVQRFLRWPRLLPLLLFSGGGFVLLQEVMGPYGTMISPRHFLTVLGVLTVVASGLLFAGCGQRRQVLSAAGLAVAIGLGCSSLDVSLREIYQHLTHGNLSQRFMQKKPILQLFQRLNEHLAGLPPAIVYSATVTNISSFLSAADLWHASMTYPAWTWGAGIGGDELGCLLRKHRVGYLITEANTPLKQGIPRGAQPLFQAQEMTLWQWSPPDGNDCRP